MATARGGAVCEGDPPGSSAQHNAKRHGCLNLGDIPVVSGSNPWISMKWLSAPRSGSSKVSDAHKTLPLSSLTSTDLPPAFQRSASTGLNNTLHPHTHTHNTHIPACSLKSARWLCCRLDRWFPTRDTPGDSSAAARWSEKHNNTQEKL